MPITLDSHLKPLANRSLLIVLSNSTLDEAECRDKFHVFARMKKLQLTADCRAAFVDFECEHAPLLIARCFELSKSDAEIPIPAGVRALLPACSYGNFYFLQHVPKALSSNAIRDHFTKQNDVVVNVFRPGIGDNLSSRVLVEFAGPVAHPRPISNYLWLVQVNTPYSIVKQFHVVPPVPMLLANGRIFDGDGCEACCVKPIRGILDTATTTKRNEETRTACTTGRSDILSREIQKRLFNAESREQDSMPSVSRHAADPLSTDSGAAAAAAAAPAAIPSFGTTAKPAAARFNSAAMSAWGGGTSDAKCGATASEEATRTKEESLPPPVPQRKWRIDDVGFDPLSLLEPPKIRVVLKPPKDEEKTQVYDETPNAVPASRTWRTRPEQVSVPPSESARDERPMMRMKESTVVPNKEDTTKEKKEYAETSKSVPASRTLTSVQRQRPQAPVPLRVLFRTNVAATPISKEVMVGTKKEAEKMERKEYGDTSNKLRCKWTESVQGDPGQNPAHLSPRDAMIMMMEATPTTADVTFASKENWEYGDTSNDPRNRGTASLQREPEQASHSLSAKPCPPETMTTQQIFEKPQEQLDRNCMKLFDPVHLSHRTAMKMMMEATPATALIPITVASTENWEYGDTWNDTRNRGATSLPREPEQEPRTSQEPKKEEKMMERKEYGSASSSVDSARQVPVHSGSFATTTIARSDSLITVHGNYVSYVENQEWSRRMEPVFLPQQERLVKSESKRKYVEQWHSTNTGRREDDEHELPPGSSGVTAEVEALRKTIDIDRYEASLREHGKRDRAYEEEAWTIFDIACAEKRREREEKSEDAVSTVEGGVHKEETKQSISLSSLLEPLRVPSRKSLIEELDSDDTLSDEEEEERKENEEYVAGSLPVQDGETRNMEEKEAQKADSVLMHSGDLAIVESAELVADALTAQPTTAQKPSRKARLEALDSDDLLSDEEEEEYDVKTASLHRREEVSGEEEEERDENEVEQGLALVEREPDTVDLPEGEKEEEREYDSDDTLPAPVVEEELDSDDLLSDEGKEERNREEYVMPSKSTPSVLQKVVEEREEEPGALPTKSVKLEETGKERQGKKVEMSVKEEERAEKRAASPRPIDAEDLDSDDELPEEKKETEEEANQPSELTVPQSATKYDLDDEFPKEEEEAELPPATPALVVPGPTIDNDSDDELPKCKEEEKREEEAELPPAISALVVPQPAVDNDADEVLDSDAEWEEEEEEEEEELPSHSTRISPTVLAAPEPAYEQEASVDMDETRPEEVEEKEKRVSAPHPIDDEGLDSDDELIEEEEEGEKRETELTPPTTRSSLPVVTAPESARGTLPSVEEDNEELEVAGASPEQTKEEEEKTAAALPHAPTHFFSPALEAPEHAYGALAAVEYDHDEELDSDDELLEERVEEEEEKKETQLTLPTAHRSPPVLAAPELTHGAIDELDSDDELPDERKEDGERGDTELPPPTTRSSPPVVAAPELSHDADDELDSDDELQEEVKAAETELIHFPPPVTSVPEPAYKTQPIADYEQVAALAADDDVSEEKREETELLPHPSVTEATHETLSAADYVNAHELDSDDELPEHAVERKTEEEKEGEERKEENKELSPPTDSTTAPIATLPSGEAQPSIDNEPVAHRPPTDVACTASEESSIDYDSDTTAAELDSDDLVEGEEDTSRVRRVRCTLARSVRYDSIPEAIDDEEEEMEKGEEEEGYDLSAGDSASDAVRAMIDEMVGNLNTAAVSRVAGATVSISSREEPDSDDTFEDTKSIGSEDTVVAEETGEEYGPLMGEEMEREPMEDQVSDDYFRRRLSTIEEESEEDDVIISLSSVQRCETIEGEEEEAEGDGEVSSTPTTLTAVSSSSVEEEQLRTTSSISEYNEWLTRDEQGSRDSECLEFSFEGEAEIVPLPSTLDQSTWGVGISMPDTVEQTEKSTVATGGVDVVLAESDDATTVVQKSPARRGFGRKPPIFASRPQDSKKDHAPAAARFD